MLKYGWPDDYPEARMAWLEAMDAGQLDALARSLVRPGELFLLVVGDLASFRDELEGLGFGTVVQLDESGRRL